MAGNDDTIQRSFYAPWPLLGTKFSQQLNEIREDTAALAPIVRGVGLDSDGNFSTLDGVEQAVMQALEIGKQDFHNKYRIHYNKDNDLFELAYNNGTEEIPHWYTTWWINSDGNVTQQNTPTTASNLGTGEGVFFQKTGVDLEFKSFKVTTPLAISSTNNDITISGAALVSTYSSDQAAAPSGDAGVGVEIILSDTGKVGNDLPFKAIKAGPNVVVTNTGTAIQIESTAQVVEFYGISVSSTTGVPSYNEVHNLLFNRDDFYITQQSTNPSNKTVIINSISDPFNSTDYVAVIGDDMTGQLAMHDGTVAEPSIGFSNETDTGIYRRASNDMSFAVAGDDVLRVLANTVLTEKKLQVTNTGSASAPDIAFFPDTDTGLFQNSAGDGSLAFATNGTRAGYFDSNQHLFLDSKLEARSIEAGYGVFYTSLVSDKFLARRSGTAAATGGVNTGPAFSWEADPDTGLFRSTTDTIATTTGGTTRSTINTTSITNTLPIFQPAGLVGTPQYSFTADTNTGLYMANDTAALHSLDVAANGVQAGSFRWTTGGVMQFIVPGVVQAGLGSTSLPSYTFTSNTNVGMYYNNASGDGIAFATDGDTDQFIIRGDGISLFGGRLILSAGGTEAAPALNIVDGNSGLYRPATDILGVTGQLSCENGTAALPGITFLGDKTDGFFWANTNSINLALNAVSHFSFQTGGVYSSIPYYFNTSATIVTQGVSLPSISWWPDTNTGLYQLTPEDDGIGFTCGGVAAGNFVYNAGSPYLNIPGEVRVADEAYGAGWDSDLSVPTKNALYDKIESVVSAAVEGFYGMTIKHSNDTHVQRNTNVFGVNVEHFYLSGEGDTATLNSRDVWVDKSGDTMTGNLTIGTGDSNDSLIEFFDSGTLAYTAGWDESAGEFKITSGPMDNTNDEIRITPDLVTINKLAGGDLTYGTGFFYTTATADRFIAHRTGTMTAGGSQPQFSFSNEVTGTGVDSGLGYNSGGGYPYIATNGFWIQFWTTGYTGIGYQIRSYSENISAPSYSWQNDSDTGMFRYTNDVNVIRFATAGALSATLDGHGDFYVPNGGIFTREVRVNDDAYSSSWDNNFRVPTKNALYDKIETLASAADINPGFYGINIKQVSNTTGEVDSYKSINTISFDTEYFYLSQNSPNTDEIFVSLKPNVAIKLGDDGLLYVWDVARQKYLSVGRTILNFSREYDNSSAAWVIHTGMISDSLTRAGTLLPRNYTITQIVGTVATIAGTGADTGPAVFTLETMSEANSQVLIHTVTLPFDTAIDLRRRYNSGPLNIDVDADLTIHFTQASSPQVTSDPIFSVEVAWRLE